MLSFCSVARYLNVQVSQICALSLDMLVLSVPDPLECNFEFSLSNRRESALSHILGRKNVYINNDQLIYISLILQFLTSFELMLSILFVSDIQF